MKKSILKITLLTLVLFTSVAINAQRGELQAKTYADTWKEKFDLSEDQHTKVYALLIKSVENRTKKMQEMSSSGDRGGMRAAFTKIQEETDKGLKKILTKAQWPMYEKWKKDNSPRRGRKRN